MPTKRRRLGHARVDVMTDAQKAHLSCGHYFFDYTEADRFRDEVHRRATWVAYREQILAEWGHPGARPDAFWEYDMQLRRRPYPREWSWPRPITTEAWMVHRLLTEGTITPCHFNGLVRIVSELETIEARWRLIISCPNAGYAGEVPRWFHRRHAKRILAEREAAAARFRASLERGNGAAME